MKKNLVFLFIQLIISNVLAEGKPPIINPQLIELPSHSEMGGFSGLFIDIKENKSRLGHLSEKGEKSLKKESEVFFWTLTDRGPNLEEKKTDQGIQRPFLNQNFQPRILKFKVNLETSKSELVKSVLLKDSDGSPLTGLPPCFIPGEKEIAVDTEFKNLGCNNLGIDPESLALDKKGHFWVGEEYLPSIIEFDQNGKLIRQLVPQGIFKKNKVKLLKGRNIIPILPAEYVHRKVNRGFEALSISGDKLYSLLQSPLHVPDKKNNKYIRMAEVDLKKFTLKAEYLFPLDMESVDKIGDMTFDQKGNLLVVEQDSRTGKDSHHWIQKVSFVGATNILGDKKHHKILPEKLESIKDHYVPLRKELKFDLVSKGLDQFDKIEGLANLNEKCVALLNDNDFGLNKSSEIGIKSYFILLCDEK